MAKFLLASGANINERNIYGRTHLSKAENLYDDGGYKEIYKNQGIAEFLLSKGATK